MVAPDNRRPRVASEGRPVPVPHMEVGAVEEEEELVPTQAATEERP